MIIAPMPPAIMNFREDYNRANSADTGPNWRKDYTTAQIITNRVQFRTMSLFEGRNGAWQTYIKATDYNGGRLLTDNWAIEMQLIAPVGTLATDNVTGVGGNMQDVIGAGMALPYVAISTGTGHGIFTYTGSGIAAPGAATGQTGQTARSTAVTNVAATSLVRIERRMYSATQSNFLTYVNGVFTVGWNDSTAVVPAGDRSRRRWFVILEGNYLAFGGPYFAPAIDWVRAYDLKL